MMRRERTEVMANDLLDVLHQRERGSRSPCLSNFPCGVYLSMKVRIASQLDGDRETDGVWRYISYDQLHGSCFKKMS